MSDLPLPPVDHQRLLAESLWIQWYGLHKAHLTRVYLQETLQIPYDDTLYTLSIKWVNQQISTKLTTQWAMLLRAGTLLVPLPVTLDHLIERIRE